MLNEHYDIHDIPVTKYNGSYMFESPALNNDKEIMQKQQFYDMRIPCQGNWCEDYFRDINACHGHTYGNICSHYVLIPVLACLSF